MAAMTGGRPGNQEPGISSTSSIGMAEALVPGPSSTVFLSILAGSTVGQPDSNQHLDIGCCCLDGLLTDSSTTLVSKITSYSIQRARLSRERERS